MTTKLTKERNVDEYSENSLTTYSEIPSNFGKPNNKNILQKGGNYNLNDKYNKENMEDISADVYNEFGIDSDDLEKLNNEFGDRENENDDQEKVVDTGFFEDPESAKDDLVDDDVEEDEEDVEDVGITKAKKKEKLGGKNEETDFIEGKRNHLSDVDNSENENENDNLETEYLGGKKKRYGNIKKILKEKEKSESDMSDDSSEDLKNSDVSDSDDSDSDYETGGKRRRKEKRDAKYYKRKYRQAYEYYRNQIPKYNEYGAQPVGKDIYNNIPLEYSGPMPNWAVNSVMQKNNSQNSMSQLNEYEKANPSFQRFYGGGDKDDKTKDNVLMFEAPEFLKNNEEPLAIDPYAENNVVPINAYKITGGGKKEKVEKFAHYNYFEHPYMNQMNLAKELNEGENFFFQKVM